MLKKSQILGIFILQLFGLYLFKDGYLLQRLDIPTVNNHTISTPKFSKTILIMIDALRFDFMKYKNIPGKETPHYMNKLAILHQKLLQEPQHSLLLRGMSDPPTTTLQRLMALVTGALPTLIDAGSNFHSALLKQDNLISHLLNQNKSVTVLGDDTWSRLFPHSTSPDSKMMESFDVWDLHSVDIEIKKYLFPILEKNEFDFLIAHFLGVDHAGHRYGPGHVAMGDKLVEMNSVIERVLDKVDKDTLVIVMGDHGMDAKGDHGGDSFDEMNAGLFLYAKKPILELDKDTLAGIIEKTKGLGSDYETVSEMYTERTIQQIDLVPTLAYLLGLPIPFGNLGSIIPEVISNKLLPTIVFENAKQVHDYIHSYTTHRPDAKSYFKYDDAFESCKKNVQESSISILERYIECSKYLRQVLFTARRIWTRFEPSLMIMGIIMLFLTSLLSLASLVYSVDWKWNGVGLGIIGLWNPIINTIYTNKDDALTVTPLHEVLFFGVIGIVILTLYSNVPKIHLKRLFKSDIPYMVVFLLYLMSMGSDSFLIFEDFMLLHFLQFLQFCQVAWFTAQGWKGLLFGSVLIRLISLITICRPDQGPYCYSTFYNQGSSTSPTHSILTSFLVLCGIMYTVSKDRGTYPIPLVWVWLYWTLDTLHPLIPTPIETFAKAIVLCFFWFFYIIGILKNGEWYWLLFLVQKPMGFVALGLGWMFILTNKSALGIQSTIGLFLFGQLVYFATGHQYTLASIQYDIGFIGLWKANYVLSPLLVSINTVSGPLLALVACWKLDNGEACDKKPIPKEVGFEKEPKRKREMLHTQTLLVLWSFTLLSATFFAFWFNRHSQSFRVWGPKFFFTSLQYLFVYGLYLLSVIFKKA